jgi:sRNA-binding protein
MGVPVRGQAARRRRRAEAERAAAEGKQMPQAEAGRATGARGACSTQTAERDPEREASLIERPGVDPNAPRMTRAIALSALTQPTVWTHRTGRLVIQRAMIVSSV